MITTEHLVLSWTPVGMGYRYKTKYHDDLGSDLQGALDVLEREGWQVITSFYSQQGARIILTRAPR